MLWVCAYLKGSVELAKNKRGKVALYLSLSEPVLKRQIKADLEKNSASS